MDDVTLDVGTVEGLRELGQDKLSPVVNLCSDDAGAVAPVEFTNRQGVGWGGILIGSRRILCGGPLVVTWFAAETTVRITGGKVIPLGCEMRYHGYACHGSCSFAPEMVLDTLILGQEAHLAGLGGAGIDNVTSQELVEP